MKTTEQAKNIQATSGSGRNKTITIFLIVALILAYMGSWAQCNFYTYSPNQTICFGDSAYIKTGPDSACQHTTFTYTWMPGNLQGQHIYVAPVATTVYTVTAVDQLGNSYTSTIPIYVTTCANHCTASAYCANPTICLGDSTLLKVYKDSSCIGNVFTYVWQPGNLSGQYVMVSPVATTEYTLTAIDQNGITQVSTVTVFVNNCNNYLNVSVSLSNPTICLGDSTILYSFVTGGVPSYSYLWMPGNLTGPSVSVSPTATTMYTLTVTDAEGDTVVTTVPVFVNNCGNNCIADFSATNRDSNMVSFTNLSTSSSFYFWSFGDGSISTEQNPVHQYLNAGTYQVCLVIVNCDNSCNDQVCRTVTVNGKKKEREKGSKLGEDASVKLFPNPANSNVSVNYSIREYTEMEINITDMLGNTMLVIEKGNKEAGSYSTDYNVDGLINGIYMVNLVTGDRVVSKRLIIAK